MIPRRAKPEDIPALRALAQQCFQPYAPLIGKMPAPGLEIFDERVERNQVWVLGSPISAYLIAYDKPPGFLIDAVAVSLRHQGKGLGKQLLQFSETLAADAGHALIWLYANEVMLSNIGLYERLGYQAFDRRREDGYDRVFMRKRLIA